MTTIQLERTAGSVRSRLDWLRAGIAIAAVGWGANQFAPMLLVYRDRMGLSDAMLEATFGFYALGLIPGLLLFGRLSDRFGRRRIVVRALLASMVASAVLIVAGPVGSGLLFVGRFVAGLASGAAFSSGAAWIKELSPSGGPRRVTVTMTAGFAGGPLVAGLLAQWAPEPTIVPYFPHLALLAIAIPLLAGVPETSSGSSRRTRVSGAELRNRRFRLVVLPLAPWVFGSAAIALAYLPGMVTNSLAFTAVVTMLTALAGIAVQPAARRINGATALIFCALGVVAVGLVVAAFAADQDSAALVVIAVLVLGAGYGLCQVCGLQEITRIAPPGALAGLTAIYQALSYLGFALPFVLAALASYFSVFALLIAVAGLAVATLVGTTLAAARTS